MKGLSDDYTNFDNSSSPMIGGVEGSPSRNSDPNQSTFLTKLPDDHEHEEWKPLLIAIHDRIDRVDDRFAE